MRAITKKWLFLKISSILLVPLMCWFIINITSFYDKSYHEVVVFFTTQPNRFIFSLFLVIAYFFSALSISEIFEDYIHDENLKKISNKLLYIFAMLIPFITIILIINLET